MCGERSRHDVAEVSQSSPQHWFALGRMTIWLGFCLSAWESFSVDHATPFFFVLCCSSVTCIPYIEDSMPENGPYEHLIRFHHLRQPHVDRLEVPRAISPWGCSFPLWAPQQPRLSSAAALTNERAQYVRNSRFEPSFYHSTSSNNLMSKWQLIWNIRCNAPYGYP